MFLDKNGTSCITLDNTIGPIDAANAFCLKNDIVIDGAPVIMDDLIFVNIDPVKTDLSSFYTWSEILPSDKPLKEVWRHFIWNNSTVDAWGTNVYLDSVDCSPYSAGYLLGGYFKTKCV